MTLKDKLIVYCYHKGNELELDKETLRCQRRFETMDSLDIYENMRADIRVDAFNEFIRDLFKIILNCDTNYTK